jgi:septation ring formation regulator EzrA
MLLQQYDLDQEQMLKSIQKSIQEVQARLEKEVAAKQKTIEHQETEISKLRADLDRKASLIVDLNTKYTDCQRTSEGNRQLINKLLNDLERSNQDIEWYKRTYEKRSLPGYLKEYLFGKKS